MVTSLTRVGNFRVLDSILGQKSHEHMAVDVAGFRALGNPRHMAAYTVGKRVDRMGHVLVDLYMAFKTLFGACCPGLGTRGGNADLMNEMAGGAGDAFLGVL